MMCATLTSEVPTPCPRIQAGSCEPCREDLIMRASVLEFGQAFSGCSDPSLPATSERATCATRDEADRLAREQAVEAMRRASAQRELFEPGET
jgi:hypothetical protein